MSDQRMRELVISSLDECATGYRRSAEEEEERAECRGGDPDVAVRRRQQAAVCRRYAAHYQQAIDLLKAAPMPPKDEPR